MTDAPEHRSPSLLDRLVPLERLAAALAMFVICAISFANVVARYTTNYSFAFTEEYSVFLMVLMTFIGTSVAVARRNHMRIAVLADRGGGWQLFCTAVSRLAALAMFALIAWYGGRLAWDQYRYGELSAGLGVPTWIYTMWMPLLALLIVARILQRWWRAPRDAA